jgi:single-strand DNA-binding protein
VLEFKIMASRSVNKVILVGHLGRDAETKFTPSGVAVSKFSIATNRRWKDQQTGEWKEETDWVNVVLWRNENLANYLTRGKQVYVEGRIQTRSYDDKDGKKVYVTDVVADDVILLGGRGADAGGGGVPFPDEEHPQMVSQPRNAQQRQRPANAPSSGPSSGPSAPEPPLGGGIGDDDVPF